MFAKPTSVGFGQQAVATLVATAVLLASIGFYTAAEAASLVDVSNTLTDSNLSAQSGHQIEFEVPTGSTIGTGDTISITFPAGFTDVDATVLGDVTVTVTPGGVASPGAFDSTGQVISFNNITAAAGAVVEIVIDEGVITNPAANGSYEFTINTGNGDEGKTRVYIIETVLVTAIVETVFEFEIQGTTTNPTINGDAVTGTSSATELPFGVLDPGGTPSMLAQTLLVTTNANSGFVVTVESDGDLRSANGAIIDTFENGNDVDTPTGWVANPPTNDVNDRTTWGHWGLTTNDADLSFGAGNYIAASTTPRLVFTHDGPADGTTQDIGRVDVAYRVQITPLQEAADDYQTVLTYIATPTF